MKVLILVRHAKSSWADAGLADRDRPLNARGKRDAPWIGDFLKRQELVPDVILTSPAVRAEKTARKLAAAMGFDKRRIEVREEIYEAGTDQLRQLVAGLDPAVSRASLVGHNPVLTDFANELTGATIDNIPTAGIVAVEFDAEDWSRAGQGRLLLFASPPKGAPAD
jgi:phosphohistidine phosphatase